MSIVKVGSNSIDVRIGIVAVNGFGGRAGPDGKVAHLNPDWFNEPEGHLVRQVAAIEEASGRKDGWVHALSVRRWAWKPWGVNADLQGEDRAPYLASIRGSWPDLWKAHEVVGECNAVYVGSTWSGDNRETPRAIAPVHMGDLAKLFDDCSRIVPAFVKRVCFDQAATLLNDSAREYAYFERVARAFAERGVEVIVEALPRDPRDLEWVSGLSRYANVMGRGLMGKDAHGRLTYPVPKGARIVIAFDGKVVREDRGGIDVAHVQRVVEWAAGFGVAGYGAAELELLIVGPQHARPVVEWGAQNGVL
jgi:hypothetical protein